MSPNGMTRAPVEFFGWKNFSTTTDEGTVTSHHTVPIEQFIHNVDKDGDCLCGPDIDYVTQAHGIVAMVVHWALERAYYGDHEFEVYD